MEDLFKMYSDLLNLFYQENIHEHTHTHTKTIKTKTHTLI